MPTTQTELNAVFAERAKRLHTPRSVAMAVLELTRQPQVNAALLTAEIQTDPALTARILRVVNSPMFATRGDIDNLEQAIAMLGDKTLRTLALGFALPDSLVKSDHAEALELYWRFAFIKSIAAKALAESIWKSPGDQAFIAGLLHDLGSLVLLQELGQDYAQLVCKAYSDGDDLCRIEKGLLGFEHAQLSAELLGHWGLPDSLITPIGEKMDAETIVKLDDNSRDLTQILHVSDLLAKFLLRKDAYSLRLLLTTVKRYKNLPTARLEVVIREIQESEPLLAEAFSQPQVDEDYIASLNQALSELTEIGEPVAELFEINAVDGLDRLAQLVQDLTETMQTADDEIGDGESPTSAINNRSTKNSPRATGTSHGAGGSLGAAKDRKVPSSFENDLIAVDGDSEARLEFDHREVLACLNGWLVRSRRTRTPISLMLFDIDIDLATAGSRQALRGEIRELIADRFQHLTCSSIHDDLGSGSIDAGQEKAPQRSTSVAYDDQNVCNQNLGRCHYVARIDRMASVELARDVLIGIESLRSGDAATVKVAISSMDLVPPNFPAQAWWDSAQRCLYGARCAGGGAIKSIVVV